MPHVIWSPAALLDVQRLYRFLEKKHLNAAKHAVRTIREGVRILGKQPEVAGQQKTWNLNIESGQ